MRGECYEDDDECQHDEYGNGYGVRHVDGFVVLSRVGEPSVYECRVAVAGLDAHELSLHLFYELPVV